MVWQTGSPSQAYNDIFNQINNIWNDPTKTQSTLGQYQNDFMQQFQNMVGRAPTADEINNFFQQAVQPIINTQAGFSATNPSDVVNQYIPQAFQSDIQQNNLNQLPKLESQLANVATGVGTQTAQQLANPLSPMYQAFSGMNNNLGISPSSGAFQAGLGGTIGAAASDAISGGLQSLGFPAIAGSQAPNLSQLYGQGMQSGQNLYGRNSELYDFNLQADLARQMQEAAQPSGFAKGIGEAASIMQGIGGAGQGIGLATLGTSYICMALINHGLATEADLDLLHYKTLGAVWKKARAFWWYATHAKELVRIAEENEVDWRSWRKWFLDDPIAKSTALEAVDEYIDAYEALCRHLGATHLWDERVRRCSVWDSIIFLPRVLTYAPFVRAARRVWKMKRMWVLDLPLSRVP